MILGRCAECRHDRQHHRDGLWTGAAFCVACQGDRHEFVSEPLPAKLRPWSVIPSGPGSFYLADADGIVFSWTDDERFAREVVALANTEVAA